MLSSDKDVVAKSTTDAELIAANAGASDGTWMMHLLEELGYPQNSPFPLHMDNQSSIKVARNPEHHGQMEALGDEILLDLGPGGFGEVGD